MRRLTLVLALASVAIAANAQSVSDYLKFRNQQHIVQPTSSQALDGIVGAKIVEIQGIVQGSFKSGETTSLMVQRDDKETQIVDCEGNPPEWLGNGEVPVRLLVRVNRDSQYGPLSATLLLASPESDVAKVDEIYWRKEAARAKGPKTHRTQSLASRGASGALYGWIGRPPHHRKDWVLPTSEVTPIYADFILKQNPRLGPAKALDIAQALVGFSIHYGVDARLVIAIVMCESGFDPNSTSRPGAMGLGQLMPGTAAWMGVQNPYDSTDNLKGSVKLLRLHLSQFRAVTGENFESLRLALAAYNAGEGAVRRHGGVPPYRETQRYVAKVIAIYEALCGPRTGA